MPHTSSNQRAARETLLNPVVVRQLLERLVPLGHHACSVDQAIAAGDLGMGLMYYAFARLLRPTRVLVVGSLRGFSVVCLALGLEDNDHGTLDFVDAGRVDEFWRHSSAVRDHFAAFHVQDRIRVHVTTTADYVERTRGAAPDLDLLFIDGDHSESGTRFDHQQLGRLVRPNGYILFHDSYAAGARFSEWQVAEYLGSLDEELHEILNFDQALGLTILRRLPEYPSAAEAIERHRALTEACRATVTAPEPPPPSERRIAALALDVLRDQRLTIKTLQSRLRFLTKANKDLWRALGRGDEILIPSSEQQAVAVGVEPLSPQGVTASRVE
jgi:predicted O-methyltransferase YrrM